MTLQHEINEHFSNLTVSSTCDQTNAKLDYPPTRCTTEVIIHEAQFDMTGYYVCQYNISSPKSAALQNYNLIRQNVLITPSGDPMTPVATELMDMIYIFVNDASNLAVPFEGQLDFFFLALFQQHPASIPCRPTFSNATVRLMKMHSNAGEEIKPNATLGISYNPKKGFYFENARWDSDSNLLQCQYNMNGLSTSTQINIHWSSR